MAKTKIEWADKVWNPVTGCTKVSEGCRHCYAERYWTRFHQGEKFSQVQCYPKRLEQPLYWKKPARIFVDSMGDLFHPKVPDAFLRDIFWIMEMAPKHIFMILTKRPLRMNRWISQEPDRALPNLWLGVSVEDQKAADMRIPWLLKTPAAMRFVSVEPMLGPINLQEWTDHCSYYCDHDDMYPEGHRPERSKIDWVICGGETGPGARPLQQEWAESLLSQCLKANVSFFFKQWGEWSNARVINGQHTMTRIGKKRAGRYLCGQNWDQYPVDHAQE